MARSKEQARKRKTPKNKEKKHKKLKPEVANAPTNEGQELVADKDTSNEKSKDQVIKQLTKERSGDEPAQSAKKKKIENEEGDRL